MMWPPAQREVLSSKCPSAVPPRAGSPATLGIAPAAWSPLTVVGSGPSNPIRMTSVTARPACPPNPRARAVNRRRDNHNRVRSA